MRLGVYTDYAYHRRGGAIYAERAFVLFLGAIAQRIDRMVLLGRVDSTGDRGRYRVDEADTDFVELSWYRSLSQPASAVRALFASTRTFWRTLDKLDAVWLLGPHPFMPLFALVARLRGRTVILGVRQDTPTYVASRHPDRPDLRIAARLLEGTFRLLARRCATIVVGPELAHNYRHADALLEIAVSLVTANDVLGPEALESRSYDADCLVALSVGRLETEKNPLLMIDALADLRRQDPRWVLRIHGEGPLVAALAERARLLGVEEHVDLAGYLAIDQGLTQVYRDSHALLHVSLTEGLPQVILEAFAAALPVVATDVGGIGDSIRDAALLIAPGDPHAAATALERIGTDPSLRRRMVERGTVWVSQRTLDVEADRVVDFLAFQNRV